LKKNFAAKDTAKAEPPTGVAERSNREDQEDDDQVNRNCYLGIAEKKGSNSSGEEVERGDKSRR
jgi:hypothetical protein